MMMMHATDETLQRLVDGELPSATATATRAHLDRCPECRARKREIETLILRVGTLLPSVEPAEDLWPGIEARLSPPAPVTSTASVSARRHAAGPRRNLRAAAWAIAAAAILMVGIALGRNLPHPAEPIALETNVVASPAITVVADEDAYAATVADLRATLAGMRADLRPETVEAIEENLRIIDAAIEDARAAFAADPASDFLLRRISIYQQTKLDVLRAATNVAVTSDI